jgi:putative glutamine amidotransferase
MPITIGISKGSGTPKYANYGAWLTGDDPDVAVLDLAQEADVAAAMARVDGLLLTGGSDVDPRRYRMPEYAAQCIDVDEERDAREFLMLEVAEARDLPVLAVCRGMQILNVFRGGTLIPHVPDRIGGSQAHGKRGDDDGEHEVIVTPGTLLFKATRELSGAVNTAHHQAVDQLGVGLVASGRAEDGIIEAIEWGNPEGKSYVLGVQWHPERMKDGSSPFSSGIREQFLFEVQSARILARATKPLPKESSHPELPEDTSGSDPLLPIIQS